MTVNQTFDFHGALGLGVVILGVLFVTCLVIVPKEPKQPPVDAVDRLIDPRGAG
jgi:hypothetical protein